MLHLVYSIFNHVDLRKNHNSIAVALNLVVLVSTISLRSVEYYYIVYSHVWCDVNFAYTCLSILLRLAVRSRESEDHPGTWNLKSQTSCALDHFFYPLMF